MSWIFLYLSPDVPHLLAGACPGHFWHHWLQWHFTSRERIDISDLRFGIAAGVHVVPHLAVRTWPGTWHCWNPLLNLPPQKKKCQNSPRTYLQHLILDCGYPILLILLWNPRPELTPSSYSGVISAGARNCHAGSSMMHIICFFLEVQLKQLGKDTDFALGRSVLDQEMRLVSVVSEVFSHRT